MGIRPYSYLPSLSPSLTVSRQARTCRAFSESDAPVTMIDVRSAFELHYQTEPLLLSASWQMLLGATVCVYSKTTPAYQITSRRAGSQYPGCALCRRQYVVHRSIALWTTNHRSTCTSQFPHRRHLRRLCGADQRSEGIED